MKLKYQQQKKSSYNFLGRRETKRKKKVKLDHQLQHAPLHREEDKMTLPITLRKGIFGRQEVSHAPFKVRRCL